MGFFQRLSTYMEAHSGSYLTLAIALALVAVGVSIFVLMKIRALMRPFARLRGVSEDPAELLAAVMRSIDETETNTQKLIAEFGKHLNESRSHLRHLGLVRYDAFEDIAGQQSYSMAFLDEDKNGVLLTYLTGKNSTRSYAVTVERGQASRKLSDEESRALDEALSRLPVVEIG